MYRPRIRYRARILVDADSVTASPRVIAELIDALDDDRLNPVTIMKKLST